MSTHPVSAPPAPQLRPDPAAGEERLVREAILLVAAGGAPRVLVAGLTYGGIALDRCRTFALEHGTRLHARATARADRLDVVVEAIH
jgi:hypothetical protein